MSGNVTPFPNAIDDAIDRMEGPTNDLAAVIVHGRRIPRLGMKRQPSGAVTLVLDGRFSIDLPAALALPVTSMVANALAIGEGFSHSGAETKGRPFAPQIMRLGVTPDE